MAHSVAARNAAKLQLKRSSGQRSTFTLCRSNARPTSIPEQATAADSSATLDRRSLLFAAGALVAASPIAAPLPSHAEETDEYELFLGLDTPPTSYGGYGGNAKEAPKYSFEYPKGWKSLPPNKVEKGTQGIDSIVISNRGKEQKAFVITLGRAGEDGKSFRVTDLESTVAGFAGADYDLQDALSNATSTEKGEHDVDGRTFFDYDVDSPDFHYLCTVTTRNGKVYAMFVRAPTRQFKSVEPKLRHMVNSFKLL